MTRLTNGYSSEKSTNSPSINDNDNSSTIMNQNNHQTNKPMIQTTMDKKENDQMRIMDSPVKQMFENRSIFITGASGFIGRVLLEKLLRCYPNIKNIYILMRQKKNQNPYDRLHKQLLNVPIFDKIRSMKNGQELLDKIVVIPGDIADNWLGISDSDLDRLFRDPTLSIVFHSAATIKFDEPLKVSVRLNLIATRTVIEFCRKLPNLISFCHVSTCYTNSDILDGQTDIEEKIYPMNDEPKDLMQLADILGEDLMQNLKRNMIKSRPNTYTYTKALAEKYISNEATDLPVAIVRPSIVVASWKDPMPGWVDNINGPTGLVLAIGKGLLRSLYAKTTCKADIIPVDIVINAMIASAYYAARAHNKFTPITATSSPMTTTTTMNHQAPSELSSSSPSPAPIMANGKSASASASSLMKKKTKTNKIISNNNNDSDNDSEIKIEDQKMTTATAATTMTTTTTTISTTTTAIATSQKQESLEVTEALSLPKPPIFQINSGDLNPITWGLMESFCMPIIRKYPSGSVLRYPYGSFKTNRWHDLITRLFVHYLPALFLDTLCLLMGKKRQLLSIYYKLHCAVAALTHFMTTNYNFKTTNLKNLRAILTKEDNEVLFMDIENLVWHDFWEGYVLGARRYILRESDDTLEQAKKSFQKSRYIELALRTGLLILLIASVTGLLYGYGFIWSSSASATTSSSSDCSLDMSSGGGGGAAAASQVIDGVKSTMTSASEATNSSGTCYNHSSLTRSMLNVF